MVLSLVVSRPVVGSVTAKHAFSRPSIRGFSIRAFCSAVPNFTTGLSPKMFMWMAEAALAPPPDSAIACIMTVASVIPNPAPPTASGIAIPSQPPCAMARCKSCGKPPLLSRSSQYSSSKRAQIRRILSRISLCCSDILNVMSVPPQGRSQYILSSPDLRFVRHHNQAPPARRRYPPLSGGRASARHLV